MQHTIFRFKLDETINDEICSFARLHRFDDRVSYKEAWKDWLDTNSELVERETRRLIDAGYTGNVQDKLFKSGRYYYRTRPQVPQDPVQRRKYTRVSADFTAAVDEHITMHADNPDVSPSVGFENFCKTCATEIATEVENLASFGVSNPEEVSDKLKKCYKNRFFIKRDAKHIKHSK